MIPIIYDWVDFHYKSNKGLAQVKLGDRRGFVRSNGDVVIPISYEDAEYFFCEDLVRVKLYGKWGSLNRTTRRWRYYFRKNRKWSNFINLISDSSL